MDQLENIFDGDDYDLQPANLPMIDHLRMEIVEDRIESVEKIQKMQSLVVSSLLAKATAHDEVMREIQKSVDEQIIALERSSKESVEALRAEMLERHAEEQQRSKSFQDNVRNKHKMQDMSISELKESCARIARQAKDKRNQSRKQIAQLEVNIISLSQAISELRKSGIRRFSGARSNCPHCQKDLTKRYIPLHIRQYCPRLRTLSSNAPAVPAPNDSLIELTHHED